MGEPNRVFISGMGGELGTLVAQRLEDEPGIAAIVGCDVDPPRSRLRRAEFHLIDPLDGAAAAALVRSVDPTHLLHLGVYEPDARSAPPLAERRNDVGALHVLGAAAEGRALQGIVVRSGLEVYGRHRGTPMCPDESVTARPSSPFGRQLEAIEQAAVAAGRDAEVPVTRLRFAPVVGAHVPSPLGRLLRLRVVPVSATADPPFALCHITDAAAAIVTSLRDAVPGAINIAGAGAVTPRQAVRSGGRLPAPVAGPGWHPARLAAHLAGAPVPRHVVELLTRGRGADTGLAGALGYEITYATATVVQHLYAWGPVAQRTLPAAA